MNTLPTAADFTSPAFSHQVARRETYDPGECCRFHLSFAYLNGRGGVAYGDQVVLARDIGQAAVSIASERNVNSLFVRRRFFSGKPASEGEVVNIVFDFPA